MTDWASILTGKTKIHLVPCREIISKLINIEVHDDLRNLIRAGKKAGFSIAAASSFRSFEGQLSIWNKKATGLKALLDEEGRALDFATLSAKEVVASIMRWSAIPGCSRHHWGSDIDVYDLNSLPYPGYKVELTPAEVADGGPFGAFHRWLDEEMERPDFPFFRPYAESLGGVSPERWHISHIGVGMDYLDRFTFELFLQTIETASLEKKEIVLESALEIYQRFITNISPP